MENKSDGGAELGNMKYLIYPVLFIGVVLFGCVTLVVDCISRPILRCLCRDIVKEFKPYIRNKNNFL